MKIMPYNSLKGATGRMLRRPGVWEQCQLWRKDGEHGPSELLDVEDFFNGDPMFLSMILQLMHHCAVDEDPVRQRV